MTEPTWIHSWAQMYGFIKERGVPEDFRRRAVFSNRLDDRNDARFKSWAQVYR